MDPNSSERVRTGPVGIASPIESARACIFSQLPRLFRFRSAGVDRLASARSLDACPASTILQVTPDEMPPVRTVFSRSPPTADLQRVRDRKLRDRGTTIPDDPITRIRPNFAHLSSGFDRGINNLYQGLEPSHRILVSKPPMQSLVPFQAPALQNWPLAHQAAADPRSVGTAPDGRAIKEITTSDLSRPT